MSDFALGALRRARTLAVCAMMHAMGTAAATLRRVRGRFPSGRLTGLMPHWKPVLTLGLLVPLFAAILLDPVYLAGRGAWSDSVTAFGRSFHTFGKSGWYLWPLGLFLVGTAFVDWGKLTRRSLARLTALTQAAWFGVLSLGSGEIASSLLKQAIGRARPQLAAVEGPYAFDSWTFDHLWASFPSGHATTFGALCCVLALLFPRFKWLLLCAALWLASTRVIVGVHYPSDVLAGLMLGGWIAYAWAVWLARRRILFKADEDGRLRARWHLGIEALARATGGAGAVGRRAARKKAAGILAVPA